MQNQNLNPYIDFNSWFDCVDDQNFKQNNISDREEVKITFTPSKLQNQIIKQEQNHHLIELLSFNDCVDRQLFKRSYHHLQIQQQFFTSNSSSNEMNIPNEQNNNDDGKKKSGYRKQKYVKQYIYSKNYRQKKKSQFKILQQQNSFLKKKIQQLQYRLREKQLQINRLKHHSNQKQLTIQQLNNQFLTKVTLFVDKLNKNLQNQSGILSPTQITDRYYQEVFRTYDQHGFLGSKKKQILNYYFNEILEVTLRDSQRYLCMLCCKNKDQKLQKQMPEYQKINHAFFEIMEMNQEKQKRLKKYICFLHPVMKQLKRNCTDFYRIFKKIMQTMDKVHQFMRSSYPQNIDFARKRMELESWFQYHKYSKMMRQLKDQWLSFIKKQKDYEADDSKKKRKQSKKQMYTNQQQI